MKINYATLEDWVRDKIQELMVKNMDDYYWSTFESGNQNSNLDGILNLLDNDKQ